MTPPLRWRLGVAGGVALIVLFVDQLTKLAVRAVGDALHVTVIPGVIDFLFVRNIGAAFSMGEGMALRSPCWRLQLSSPLPCTWFVRLNSHA